MNVFPRTCFPRALFARLRRSLNTRSGGAKVMPPVRLGRHFPIRLMLDGMNRRSVAYRALMTNPGTTLPHDNERVYARNLEVPSGGGVGTARAIARAYSVFCDWRTRAGIASRDAA